MKKVFFVLAILFSFSIVLPVMAETWTDPTCDPPDCNTDGPVWVNPDSSQSGFIDLSYDETDDTPVLQIIDTRASGAPEASFYVSSSVDDKSAIYGYSTGTGTAYGGQFLASNNAGLLISGGMKFTGLTDLNEPTYIDAGLLYYNTDSNLFKFYNGTQWVDLDNQWTSNGDEIYRSFATSATGQGVAIKSGDATNPNDDYNLDVYRKSLGIGDKGVYSRLDMVSTTDYVSGTLAGYEGALPVGVIGKAELANGIGVYGVGDQAAAYFSGEVGINDSDPSYDLDIIGDVLIDDGSGNYGVYIGNVADAPGAQSLYLLENGSNGLIRNYLDNGSLTLQGGSTASLSNQIVIAGGSNTDDIKFNNGGTNVASINNTGDFYVGAASASDEDFIYFDSAGSEYFKWDNTATRFELSDGLYAEEATLGGTGVNGTATGTGVQTNYGGYFEAAGDTGVGVYGHADYSSTDSTINYGGYFVADAGKGYGVYGEATSTADYNATGGYFTSSATRGRGVQGYATDTSSTYTKYGGYFRADGATDAGVYGWATSGDASNYHYGLWGHADNTNGIGVYGYGTAYSGYFTDAPVVITDQGGPGGAVTVTSNTYATSDGELYVENDIESDAIIYAGSSMRAPVFYDLNNTTYYLDPSSSTSARLEGDISLGYGSNSDDDFIYFDQTAESMKWDNASTRFEFTDEVYATSFRSSYGYLTYITATNVSTSGMLSATDAASNPMYVNRTSTDGNLIRFDNDGVFAGTISVSGTTVSYNAFTGSHYVLPEEKMERGMLVELTGKNKVLADSEFSEPLYSVKLSTKINSPAIIGSFLSESNDGEEFSLAQAVGNGEMWIMDNGEDLEIGDYLISSDLKGHAMKVSDEFAEANIVARLAENVDWSNVDKTIDGVKHKLVSVFFESFVMKNNDKKLEEQEKEIDLLKKQVEYLIEKVQ